MTALIGRRTWAIAEGYIPPGSTGTTRELISHETVCILNAGAEDARIEIMVYFANREPVGPYKFTCGARRTVHLRFNRFHRPQPGAQGHGFFQRHNLERAGDQRSARGSTRGNPLWRS